MWLIKNIGLAPKLSFPKKIKLEIDCGVPEEPILGPILFLIYVK